MSKLRTNRVTKALKRAVKNLQTMTPEKRVQLLVNSGSLKPEEAAAAAKKLRS